MGLNPSAFAVSELRARGLAFIAVGIVLAAADAALHGPGLLAEVIAGAVVVGGLMYWVVQGRIGSVLAQAGAVRAAVSEPAVDTQFRVVYQLAPVVAVLLLLDFAFGHVASIAGIPLGAGIALLVDSARLKTWEGLNSLRLLHQLTPGGSDWARWMGALRPADYSLCANAGVTPAMTGTSAKRI
jgi:hypothetical protein